jgi:hypothetical protein
MTVTVSRLFSTFARPRDRTDFRTARHRRATFHASLGDASL